MSKKLFDADSIDFEVQPDLNRLNRCLRLFNQVAISSLHPIVDEKKHRVEAFRVKLEGPKDDMCLLSEMLESLGLKYAKQWLARRK